MPGPTRTDATVPPRTDGRQAPPSGPPAQFPPDILNKAAILGMPPEAVADPKQRAAVEERWRGLYGSDANNGLQAVVERYSKQAEGLSAEYRLSAGDPPNLAQLREQALAKLREKGAVDIEALRDRPLAEILGTLALHARPVEPPPPRAPDAPAPQPPGTGLPPPQSGRTGAPPAAPPGSDPAIPAILAKSDTEFLDAVRSRWKTLAAPGQSPARRQAFMEELVPQLSDEQLRLLTQPSDKPLDRDIAKTATEIYSRTDPRQ